MSILRRTLEAGLVVTLGVAGAFAAMRWAVGPYVGEGAVLGLSPANLRFALTWSGGPSGAALVLGAVLRARKWRGALPVSVAVVLLGSVLLGVVWALSASV